MSPNLTAFLAMLRHAEGTDKAPDPYRVTYGYRHQIKDLSDHPAITGEWTGLALPPKFCRKAGLKSPCKSTAAGAYQITVPTWRHLRTSASSMLPDFTGPSQDRAAALLIQWAGAIEAVEEGRLLRAISKCRNRWASLPGAGRGQPERKLSALVAYYQQAGGTLA